MTKLRTDSISQKGLGAGIILLWITLTSASPIRGWSYEVFILQHFLSIAAFVTVLYIHVPPENHIWIYFPIALYSLDHLLRLSTSLLTNLHPKNPSLWSSKATLTPLPNHTTKITLRPPPLKSWSPGQHILLSCPSLLPFQSHPFTIASLPSDGEMSFFVKAKRGATSHFFKHAGRCHTLLPRTTTPPAASSTRTVAVEGPYGRVRPLRQFDTVVFVAGGTGAGFTVPLLRELVGLWGGEDGVGVVTRVVRFVWVVRDVGVVEGMFPGVLEGVVRDVVALERELGQGRRRRVGVGVYVTRDGGFVGEEERKSIDEDERGECGGVEVVGSSDSGSRESFQDEKKGEDEDLRISAKEKATDDDSSEDSESVAGEQAQGCCCRTTTPEDKDTIIPACTCATTKSSCQLPSPTSPSINPPPQPTSTITHHKGRPPLPSILRQELEQARGETAVVVCGPAGLVDTVMGVCVRLSDERAVHKGTGAQGVWVWGVGGGC